jgi:hypothetical protein
LKPPPKVKKPSAADRTVDMFAQVGPMDTREAEAIQDDEKTDRVSMEEDADRMRLKAFQGQEWASKCFAQIDAPGNEYRMSRHGDHYYLETILKELGKPLAYGYTGVMVHKRDLLEMTKVCVAAVRALQALEKP